MTISSGVWTFGVTGGSITGLANGTTGVVYPSARPSRVNGVTVAPGTYKIVAGKPVLVSK
ncbi:hypothetical protein ALI44B_13670 [Leifsonia sp. ALI-44-B]|uniref:hypothetical protein n=1 Tax=Leifsonia sp. ALI-44-B TaxID=1933776 RepID=UPI00097BCE90|nr:hypothetical protein [Leifsonia sp. ALI-44-B]ONI61459.1 hypothetical protein ALI44B_13670 [Leifsonia sp. ALI-44-B]